MMKKTIQLLIAIGVTIISWLALSFVFFPIESSTPSDVYFTEAITYMAPLKAVITIVFVLLALFLYEQKMKKKKNK